MAQTSMKRARETIVVSDEPRSETNVLHDCQAGINNHSKMHVSDTSCIKNYKDNTLCVDGVSNQNKVEAVVVGDSDVDILECEGTGPMLVCDNDANEMEYSSSFDGTFSGSEDGYKNDSSDAESQLQLDGFPPFFNGYNRLFRKKKMSDHWRKFIRPLMWRCRLVELKIKELKSQAAKYDKELLAYKHVKHSQLATVSPDKCAARELPWTCQRRTKVLKRRKRKRLEDMVDVPSYMSQHVIFSCYDKKPEPDGLSADDGYSHQEWNPSSHDDPVDRYDWPIPKIEGDDKFLEQILLDVESAQVRVLELRRQLDNIISNHAVEIYTPGMFIPGDPHYRPSLSPRCSPVNNGDAVPFEAVNTPPYVSEYDNTEDMVMPGSAVSSFGDISHPDIIESTVDLLSSAIDHSRNRHQIGNLDNDAADDILICNQAAEEELHNFEKVSQQPEKLQVAVKDEEDESFAREVSSSETETDPEIAPAVERKTVMKRCQNLDINLRRSKRKRKVRKASPGSWNGEKIRKKKQLKRSR